MTKYARGPLSLRESVAGKAYSVKPSLGALDMAQTGHIPLNAVAIFRRYRGATVPACDVFVGAFHLHWSIAKDPVHRRDLPVRQPALDQGCQ